jgi:hypothetical protein
LFCGDYELVFRFVCEGAVFLQRIVLSVVTAEIEVMQMHDDDNDDKQIHKQHLCGSSQDTSTENPMQNRFLDLNPLAQAAAASDAHVEAQSISQDTVSKYVKAGFKLYLM